MLQPVDPHTWRRVIRRCRLGPSTKLVAAVLADYASPDGTRIHPGTVRLTRVTELSDKSVRTALGKLRDAGLVERVFSGSKAGRRGLADEYRLTIPEDLFDRLDLLDPIERPVDNQDPQPVDNQAEEPESPVTITGDTPRPARRVFAGQRGTPVNGAGTPVTITAHLTRYSPNQDQPHFCPYGVAVESEPARARSPPGYPQPS